MGAYFFQTDISEITAGLKIANQKQSFRLYARAGSQRDNIRENKNVATKRFIGSLACTFQPVQAYGLDIQLSNFGVSQQPGLKSISDTAQLRNINMQIIISPRVFLSGGDLNHLINVILGYNNLNDKNDFTRDLTEIQSTNLTGSYTVQYLPYALSLTAGYN
jgi:hypothetical protein